jgi:hypothetical protein
VAGVLQRVLHLRDGGQEEAVEVRHLRTLRGHGSRSQAGRARLPDILRLAAPGVGADHGVNDRAGLVGAAEQTAMQERRVGTSSAFSTAANPWPRRRYRQAKETKCGGTGDGKSERPIVAMRLGKPVQGTRRSEADAGDRATRGLYKACAVQSARCGAFG